MHILKKSKEKKKLSIKLLFRSKYVSLVVGLILIFLTVIFWRITQVDSLAKLLQNVESETEIYASKIENRIDNIEFSLDELAGYGAPITLEEQEEWDRRTNFHIENLTGIMNIVWVDKDLIIRRITSIQNSEYIVGEMINFEDHRTDYTDLILPIYNGGIIEGFILCDISVSALILSIGDEFEIDYMIQVFDKDGLLATSDNWYQTNSNLMVRKNVSFKSKTFSFELTPTKETMSLNTNKSYLVLLFGFFLSFIASSILYTKRVSNNRLEALVAELVSAKKRLEEANNDLEEFSYSVSHDLKAPVRHITGFASLLEKKYIHLLPEEPKHYIDNILASSKRMAELIDGLLLLSKVGRLELNKTLLNMNQIVDSFIKPIINMDEEHRINLDVESLPSAFGDLEMLKSVWSNLIENAVKFSKNKTLAKIRIGFLETTTEIQYFIEDNGAGFDMVYIGKLFNVFQRLHTQTEFEGTGIGLAVIKRIVIKHGGKIWAEGNVGSGAKFYFTLPKRKEGTIK